MKNPRNRTALLAVGLIFLLGVSALGGCNFLRQRKGEDLAEATKAELRAFIDNMAYVKDEKTGLCYAVLNNTTDGYRNTFTFAIVPCDKVGL